MAIFVITILGVVLRAVNLLKTAGFDYDQEVAAFWIKNLLVDHKFSLIGQEISVGGVYIAPFFYYLMAPFYALFNLNPIAGNIFVTIVSALTIVAIYKLGKQVFSKNIGIICAFLYAIHPGIIAYDKTVAPSNLIMLFSATLALLLTKKLKKLKDYILIGIILGLSFSVHPTAVLLVFICVFFVKRKYFPLIFLLILIFISPLLLFDLRHNWLNISNVFKLFNFSGGGLRIWESLQLWLVYWTGIIVSSDLLFIKYPLMAVALVVWVKNNLFFKVWTIIPLFFIMVYPKHVPEYYLLILTPIILVYTIGYLNKKLVVLVVLLAVIFSIKNLNFRDNLTGLYYKTLVVKSLPKSQPVTIYFSNNPGQNWGFDYLFWLHKVNKRPNTHNIYQIIIPASREPLTPGVLFGDIKIAKID